MDKGWWAVIIGQFSWTSYMYLTVFASFLKVVPLAGKISEKRNEKKLLVEIKNLLIKSLKMCFLFETA